MSDKIIFAKKNDNECFVKIETSTKKLEGQIATFLYRKLTYSDDKTRHSWEFDQGFVDGNAHVFNKQTRTIPLGLIPKTAGYLTEGYPSLKIGVCDEVRRIYSNPQGDLKRENIKGFHDSLKIHNVETGKKLTPYDHQIDLFERAINGRRISILACTSSGKSLSIYALARYLMEKDKKKVLVITPSSALVLQLYLDFKNEYGWKEVDDKCTLIYGTSKDKLTAKQKQKLEELELGEEAMLKEVTISTWQSLQNKIPELCPKCAKNEQASCPKCIESKKRSEKFFGTFSAVIVDEAHSTKGEVLRDILSQCVNAADFKIGMSGTIPDDGLDSAWIEGSLGRKEVVIRLHELIEMKILPPLEINSIGIPYDETIRKYVCRQNYRDEYALLTNNGSRKRVMELLIKSGKIGEGENSLVLFKNKATLDEMHAHLEKNFPQLKYHIIKGEISPAKRDVIRDILKESLGNVILATYGTMKQGVNIPSLHNLVFAEFSKSMYEIVQSMGRVARACIGKDKSSIYDIFDDCSYNSKPRKVGGLSRLMLNYSMKHYYTRNLYYEDEKLPVTEFSLAGIYEATIYPDELEEKKDAAKKKAAEKKKKKKKKGESKPPLRKKSQFA